MKHRMQSAMTVVLLSLLAQGAIAWQQSPPLTGTSTDPNQELDTVYAVHIDGDGNIVATGITSNNHVPPATGASRDFTVLKVRAKDGVTVWTQPYVFNGSGNGPDQAFPVAVDSSNNVIAAGSSRINNSGTVTSDVMLAKLGTSSGTITWSGGSPLLLNGVNGANQDDTVSNRRAVVANSSGDIFLAGGIWNKIGTQSYREFRIVKVRGSDKAVLWNTSATDTGAIPGASASAFDIADALALDGSGNVVAAGMLKYAATGSDFFVAKFAGNTGIRSWYRNFNRGINASDRAYGVAIDASGNALVVGSTATATSTDLTLVKLSGSNGATLWGPVYISGLDGNPAYTVGLDSSGNAVIAGYIGIGSTELLRVYKYRGTDGVLLWGPKDLPGSVRKDNDLDVRVDSAGNVLVTGTTDAGSFGTDLAVMKLWGSDGSQVWPSVIKIRGTASVGDNQGWRIASDSVNDVVVAGYIENNSTDDDWGIYKLGACTGDKSVVCGNGTIEPGEACDDGNTINGDDCTSFCRVECTGDCNANGVVTQTEVDLATNISFGSQPLSSCRAVDANNSCSVSAAELTAATNMKNSGCP